MAQKQYVNLDENPSKPEEGPFVELTADVTEKNPGDSVGQNGYFFFADPDAQGNLPLKHFPHAMRPMGYEKDNKYSISAPIDDKKMKKAARIGSGGGDKFKFKYGKKDDGSDAKAHSHEVVEVWRKVFVNAGNMSGASPVDLGDLKSDYDPVFIEFEQAGGSAAILHEPFCFALEPIMTQLKAVTAHGSQTAHVAMVDRLLRRDFLSTDPIQIWPAKTVVGRVKDWIHQISGGNMTVDLKDKKTWPDDNAWLFGARAILSEKGRPPDERFLADPESFVFKDTSKPCWRHPEGAMVSHLRIDKDVLRKQLITMMTENTNKIEIEIKLHVVGSAPLGYALAQYLIVGTRHPYSGDVLAKAQIAKTLVHEFGHILGQVPHYLPEYSLDKAEAQPQKTNDKWYNDEKGGKGSHCSTGAKEVKGKINGQTTMVFRGGSCLMFHEGNEPRPFCSRCQVILKRANLQVLGIASVWPGGWTP